MEQRLGQMETYQRQFDLKSGPTGKDFAEVKIVGNPCIKSHMSSRRCVNKVVLQCEAAGLAVGGSF